MIKLKKQTLDGNVETLLLTILEDGPSYGYAIVKELNVRAENLLKLGEGTVYPVLHRMEKRKLLSAKWQHAGSGRQRKYYRITQKGKKALVRIREGHRKHLIAQRPLLIK